VPSPARGPDFGGRDPAAPCRRPGHRPEDFPGGAGGGSRRGNGHPGKGRPQSSLRRTYVSSSAFPSIRFLICAVPRRMLPQTFTPRRNAVLSVQSATLPSPSATLPSLSASLNCQSVASSKSARRSPCQSGTSRPSLQNSPCQSAVSSSAPRRSPCQNAISRSCRPRWPRRSAIASSRRRTSPYATSTST